MKQKKKTSLLGNAESNNVHMLVEYDVRLKRVNLEVKEPMGSPIKEPNDVLKIAQTLIGDCGQEVFLVFFLDIRNKVIGYQEMFKGGLSSTIVDPKVVFRNALLANASSIIVSHNHPSGNLQFSEDDITLTNNLKKVSKSLGLPLLDHVLVSMDGAVSGAQLGIV